MYICSGSADPFGALAFRASAGAALSANVYFGDEAVLKVGNHLKTIAVRRAARAGRVAWPDCKWGREALLIFLV